MPYLSEVEIDPNKDINYGVTHYDPQRAFNGLNVYLCETLSAAPILDMNGEVVHTLIDLRPNVSQGWKLVEPYLSQEFLVLVEDRSIFKIDWQSNVQWETKERFHHDISVAENGDIYTVANRKITFAPFTKKYPILDNDLVILSPEGKVKKALSFARMIARDPVLLEAVRNDDVRETHYDANVWDPMHTNTIEIVERDVVFAGQRLFKKGQVLFCMRQLDLVGVVDVDAAKIIWYWGPGELDNPHQPSLLEDGHILIFDNGSRRGYSRVIEINPLTGEIVDQYTADPPTSFFTNANGSSERLPNGNTLVCESERGRTFELSPQKQMVWEFISWPPSNQLRERTTLYRMPRLIDPQRYPAFDRTSAIAHHRMGVGLIIVGRLDDAISHFRQALRLDPDFADAHYNLGNALASDGRFDEAIGHYRQAIRIKPDDAPAHNNLGLAVHSQGQIDEAISHFQSAVRADPKFADAHFNLGNALATDDRVDEAISHYQLAVRADPKFADAHYNLGNSLAIERRFDEALAPLGEALRLMPDYTAALNLMAWILATHPDAAVRDAAASIEHAQRAARLTDNQNPPILDTLAAAYAAAGRFDDAVSTAQTAMELATAAGDELLTEEFRRRLDLYRQERPYREPRPMPEAEAR